MDNEAVDFDARERRDVQWVEVVFPLLGCAFAVYYLTTIWDIPRQSQISGFFLCSLIFIFSGLFFYRFVSRPRGAHAVRSGLAQVLGERALCQQRLGLLLSTVIYVALCPLLGFTLATWLFLICSFALLGVRSLARLFGVSVAMALVGYLFFMVLLDAPLPLGPVGEVLNLSLRSLGWIGSGA